MAGYYGKQNQEMAQYLLKQDYIDLVGTDLHHLRHLDALRHSPAVSEYGEGVSSERPINEYETYLSSKGSWVPISYSTSAAAEELGRTLK